MTYRSDSEVKELVKAFEDRSLTKEKWTHPAHLTVGLYYCLHHPFGAAKNLISDGICWLNDMHGTPNTETGGYHETLTVFWLKRVWNFIDKHSEESRLWILANELIATYGNPKLPLNYYSSDLLFSPEARRQYVRPDLQKIRENRIAFMSGTLLPI